MKNVESIIQMDLVQCKKKKCIWKLYNQYCNCQFVTMVVNEWVNNELITLKKKVNQPNAY